MAQHIEINPDPKSLPLSLADRAMAMARGMQTSNAGTIRVPTGNGNDFIAGKGAQDGANWIDSEGVQHPIVDTSSIDKAAQDAQKAADAAAAKADEAIKQGEQVRSDLTRQVQGVKSEMDSTVKAAQSSANKAQSAADAAQKAADKANASTADLDKSVKAVDAKAIAAKQAAAEAQSKAENVASNLDSANAVIEQHANELGELTTKVSNAVKKSDSALSVSTEAKQTATEASTTATSAYADAQTALTQSTTATQTATAAKTTAESASKTASDSLKQSSAAVQTANQISTTLKTEYQTKADADRIYATQSSLKQTSDSITVSVSKTYATKDALSAFQNIANNAIESWRGTGVPTLTNKPASGWTTDADKKKHSGDLYYDKSTGKAYRFGSDDGETYTWELNQDADVTKALADAAKAQTSANNAQASATAANTAAGKAQSTANTAVSNAATAKNAADAAQSSANKAQGDVDKLKIDIPETYATKSSLTQTAESITANVESVKATANSAVTAASKAQQTADSISANLTKNYQTKSQADTIYATKASLKATSDSISAEVTKAQGTADGAVTAASKAQQTADAVTLNLSKNYNTKAQNDALYATQTSLKATSDSLSANITANAKTAQSAIDKATSLEANLNGFKTTVAETYTTKNDFNNLTIGGRNLLKNTSPKWSDWIAITPNVPNFCVTIGSCTIEDGLVPDAWYSSQIELEFTDVTSTEGHTATAYSQGSVDGGWGIFNPFTNNLLPQTAIKNTVYNLKHSNKARRTNAKNKQFWFQIRCDYFASGKIRYRKAKWETGNKPTDWSPAPDDLQPAGDYATNSSLTQTASQIRGEVSEKYQSKSGMSNYATTSALTQKANEITGKVQEVAKTTQGNTQTISQVSQKADRINTTLSQQINGKADVSRVSSLEQSLSGFKASVAQSYQPKGDYPTKTEMQSSISQSASSIKSEVANTYTTQAATEALRKSATRTFTIGGAEGKAKWVKLGHLTSNRDSSSILLHVQSGDGYNGRASQNAEFEIFVKDGWQQSTSATGAFGVSVSRIRNADDVKVKVMATSSTTCDIWAYMPWAYWNGHYTLQGDYKSWQDGPNCGGTRIQDAEPTSGTAQNLAYDTLSTRSYVDQKAQSVALGVVQSYKGRDGSGLATKSDITAAKNSITSTVSSTYATKTGVTQEISSKITQNNNSLDVRFSTKTETKAARDTANTANSHASDAQSRVGSLESCIRMTSAGVRVGHIVNGEFQGCSALLNSAGSFDVLDRDSSLLARFDAKGLTMAGGRLWLNDVPQHRDPDLDWEGRGNGGFSVKLTHFGGRMFLIRASTTVRAAHVGAADYKITDALPYSFIYTRIAGYLHVNGLPVGTAFGLVDGKTLYISTEDYGNEVSQEISGVAIVSGF
ncbi:hypothetical protein QAA45_01680 [Bifidobacterium breve]|uniref:hypothetical protein n=1 Tax=Bifidobacterium breve TaxID=1685 RepID=UPI0026493729|nr:hypothetical protein [Bifidobacterium breve]MDO8168593.1 hypothetical protein [Bifidobacterium breve]